MENFIRGLPKAELHIHIEGSLEPELMFELAERNKIELPFTSVEEVRAAYEFNDLQSFLDIYYQGARVLISEQDFFDLTWAYLEKCKQENIRHSEIFFDPQTHLERGIKFETVVNGIYAAMEQAKARYSITSYLILCFLRHLPESSALAVLEQAIPFKDKIIGVGLDSSEKNFPPELFQHVFAKAKQQGFRLVAHAGEEGPADYIWQAIRLLDIERVDHGVRCEEDPGLMKYLSDTQIPLTVCPLSNTKLKVFDNMSQHNLARLLDQKLCVTVNSDDPAYFGGYLNQNYLSCAKALSLSRLQLERLAINSVVASFLPDTRKYALIEEIETYTENN